MAAVCAREVKLPPYCSTGYLLPLVQLYISLCCLTWVTESIRKLRHSINIYKGKDSYLNSK